MARRARPLRWDDETMANAERFQGEVLLVRCAHAYPPGRPLSLTLDAGDHELALSGRCIGSKRQPEGDFAVRLRLTNLRREARLWLQAHLLE